MIRKLLPTIAKEMSFLPGRRGFLKSALFAGAFAVTTRLLNVRNSTVQASGQLAGKDNPISVEEAVAFVRQFNTYQAVHYGEHGKHADLLSALVAVREKDEHIRKRTKWGGQLNPYSAAVFPGWTLDYATTGESKLAKDEEGKPLATGYRLVLRGPEYTVISDETVVIYKAKTPPLAPAASDLRSAESFPEAVAY